MCDFFSGNLREGFGEGNILKDWQRLEISV